MKKIYYYAIQEIEVPDSLSDEEIEKAVECAAIDLTHDTQVIYCWSEDMTYLLC